MGEATGGEVKGKGSGRHFLRQTMAVHASTRDLREPASCFETLRTDTLTATSCHTHYALEVPGPLAHLGSQKEDSTWVSFFLWNCGGGWANYPCLQLDKEKSKT